MQNATSTSTSKNNNIEQLQQQVHKGAEETKSYLDTLKSKIADYDEQYKVSGTAASYLDSGLKAANASVDELKELGSKMKESSATTYDEWAAFTKESIADVNTSLEKLRSQAKEYDERSRATANKTMEDAVEATKDTADSVNSEVESKRVSANQTTDDAMKSVKDTAVSTKDSISATLESIVTSTREEATSAWEQLSETLAGVQKSASESTLFQTGKEYVNQGKDYVNNAVTDSKDTTITKDDTVEQLKNHIDKGTEETKSYLDTLKDQIADYDKQYKVSDTASSYLDSSIAMAQESVDELKKLGTKMQEESSETYNDWVMSTRKSLDNVNESLADLKKRAVEYDEKQRASASKAMEDVLGSAKETANSVSSTVESKREAANQTMDESMKNAKEAVLSTKDSMTSTLESIVTSTREGATEGMDQLSETLTNMEKSISESTLFQKSVDYVNQGVEYITSAFQSSTETSTSKAP